MAQLLDMHRVLACQQIRVSTWAATADRQCRGDIYNNVDDLCLVRPDHWSTDGKFYFGIRTQPSQRCH